MDPTANLQEQLQISRDIVDHDYPTDQLAYKAERLAELALSLNYWITGGGFLPDQWSNRG